MTPAAPDGRSIGYDEVLPLLVSACPSFPASDEARQVDEADGEFLHVGHFVAHLIALLARHDAGAFPAVFATVERVLVEGDDEARNLVEAGFLDELGRAQSYAGSGVAPEGFLPWLGDRTRQAWS